MIVQSALALQTLLSGVLQTLRPKVIPEARDRQWQCRRPSEQNTGLVCAYENHGDGSSPGQQSAEASLSLFPLPSPSLDWVMFQVFLVTVAPCL